MEDKIKALPDDALIRLKMQEDAEFKARRYKLLGIGKQATFTSSRDGRNIRMLITGRGPKNMTGYECDKYGNKIGLQWRVHPDFLTPVLAEKKPTAPVVGGAKDRPQSNMAGSF